MYFGTTTIVKHPSEICCDDRRRRRSRVDTRRGVAGCSEYVGLSLQMRACKAQECDKECYLSEPAANRIHEISFEDERDDFVVGIRIETAAGNNCSRVT